MKDFFERIKAMNFVPVYMILIITRPEKGTEKCQEQ